MSIEQELEEMQALADSILIVGDLNVHHKSWLRVSWEDSVKGSRLKDICDSYGLRQMVTAPTRGDYLLDLVLSSHWDVKTTVRHQITDHNAVIASIPDTMEERHLATRRA